LSGSSLVINYQPSALIRPQPSFLSKPRAIPAHHRIASGPPVARSPGRGEADRRTWRFHFENLLSVPLGRDDPEPPPTPGIEVRPAEAGEADLYARVVAPNFVGPGESIEDVLEMMAVTLEMENVSCLLALIDGESVGGGAVLMHRGLALLAGAATLPPYRRRGVHAALHHARLALARRAGCDLAAQGALPGSTSQRNAERRGLRVAYTRAVLVQEPAGST
jgi:GNAT superfamily N-acetyltransferase